MAFLTGPLDHVLGTTSKVRLLRLLLEQDRTLSAREISRLTKVSRPAVLVAIEDLVELGVIFREQSGNQFLCRANRDHKLVQIALAPLFQAEVRWPELVITEILKIALRADRSPDDQSEAGVIAAWLFGSVTRGRDEPESDLDLFVLTQNDDQADAVRSRFDAAWAKLKDEFGADVRPVAMSYNRALSQFNEGNPLIKNAVNDARVIFGKVPEELQGG